MSENKYTTYISKLYLGNYKCFKGKQEFDFTDGNGKLNQWTIFLGNNNTGKTNLLRAIADLEPVEAEIKTKENRIIKEILPFAIARSLEKDDTYKNLDKSFKVACDIFFSESKTVDIFNNLTQSAAMFSRKNDWDVGYRKWSFHETPLHQPIESMKKMKLYGYGVSRKSSKKLAELEGVHHDTETLYNNHGNLQSIEYLLIQLNYLKKNDNPTAEKQLDMLTEIVTNKVFPEIKAIRFPKEDIRVEFQIGDGWFKFDEIGFGYQITLSWLFDFAKKMFDRYPDSENPLEEPAILLIDEIDLHLHPEWQKKIIAYLTNLMPKTQFIVTTHSPLVIQSMKSMNLFVLTRDEQTGAVNSQKMDKDSYQGWTVEQILEDVMNIQNASYGDDTQAYFKEFNDALDEEDYEKAKNAFNDLDQILHIHNSKRQIMKIQLSQMDYDD
jgi:predicted ATP-binding protein involved in virulence